jgi:LacI family transcriptional regulator
VTLADVASEAGTSTAVVSYVLNDGPRPVATATRERVLEAIAKLDYTPDRVARALRRRRTGMVGLIVPDVTLPFFGTLARSIEAAIASREDLLITSNSNFDPAAEERAARAFLDAGIDGLIIVSEGLNRSTSEIAARSGVETVWLHQQPETMPAAVIRSDHVTAGRIAAEHLVREHGRGSLAFVGSPMGRGTLAHRYQGFLTGSGNAAQHLLATDLTPEDAYSQVQGLLAREPVDGIVAGTYGQAAAALRAALDSGRSVPEDVSVVAFDNDVRGQYAQTVLTSVEQDVDLIARLAVERVLRAPEKVTEQTVLPVSLLIGESCGCSSDLRR